MSSAFGKTKRPVILPACYKRVSFLRVEMSSCAQFLTAIDSIRVAQDQAQDPDLVKDILGKLLSSCTHNTSSTLLNQAHLHSIVGLRHFSDPVRKLGISDLVMLRVRC